MPVTTPPPDYCPEFEVLDDAGQHKIFCCPVLGEAEPNYSTKTTSGFLRGEIRYFVCRRCGVSDGTLHPDTNDDLPEKVLDPDYCFCAFEVEVTHSGSSKDNNSVDRRFYAIYKSKFIRPARTRKDGRRGGIVKETEGTKLAQAQEVGFHSSLTASAGRDGWGLKLTDGQTQDNSSASSNEPKDGTKHKYRLVLTQEADWRCKAHELLFKVKLYQWEAALGAPQHTLAKLADILGDPLQKPYQPGDELKLVKDSSEMNGSKSIAPAKVYPDDGESLNKYGTIRRWKGYPMYFRRSNGLWWPARATVYEVSKLRCEICAQGDPALFYMNMRAEPRPYQKCVLCQERDFMAKYGRSWTPLLQPPFA